MDYYVLQATKLKDQETAVAVTTKTEEKEARMLFHQILASAYANNKLENIVVEITNEYGGRIDIENWHASEPEPEPEA